MKFFVILLIFVGSAMLAPDAFATHDPTYNHPTPFGLSESNYQFIDFSYTHNAGESIKFILEKSRDSNCNSYNAEITDDGGKFVWGGGVDIDCSSVSISNSIPYQTKIGYKESHPIIINESGKYHLEVEFDDIFIKREFVVRQNHGELNIDDTNYSNSREFPSPLKQFKSGITIDEIQCEELLILVTKYDGSPACVKPETISKLIERNWTTQSIVHDIIFKTMSKNLGPECEQNTMDDILSGMVDEKCSKFMDELVNEHHSEMMQRGYSFDQEKNSWVKDGYPDVMMSITDYYQQNLKIVESEPEPERESESELQLYNAKKSLELSYYENVNLGPLKINDVIVGFGIENDMLIIDVLYRYSTSSEMDIVKQKIRNIVGDEIKIEYITFKSPPQVIEMAMPYHWNQYLHQNDIEFAPAYPSHGNNDDGISDGHILCSPLVAPNGTEFYIASTVDVEPFLITDTFIVPEKPEFCKKTWKTDVLLEEPDRITSLWLAMGRGELENEN